MLKKLLIGVGFAAITAYPTAHDSGAVRIIGSSNAAELGYAPQISDERGVKVTVTLQRNPRRGENMGFPCDSGSPHSGLER